MRIKEWNSKFENHQTRKLKRLLWVPIPNSFDGKTYRKLSLRDDFARVYGVWCLLVKVASRQPERGTLADEDGPLTIADIAAQTGCPESDLKHGIEVLTKYGWLLPSVDNLPQSPDASGSSADKAADKAAASTAIEEGMEGREWKEGKEKKQPSFSSDADADRENLESFRESLSRHAKRDLIWAAGQRNDPGMVTRTREQVLALVGVHGWDTTEKAYRYAYDYKPAQSIAMLGNGAADWIAKNAKPPEERQKEQTRTESPAGKIKARHDAAKGLGRELLFTPKPGKCFVIEVADYNAVVMRAKTGGDAITAKGPEIARDFGKHLADEYWTTEEPESV